MSENKKTLRVAGCLIEHEGQILILHRSKVETAPSLWGLPAGKVEKDETDLQAIIREVNEETGIKLNPESIELAGELPIEYPDITVTFPVFKVLLDKKPDVKL